MSTKAQITYEGKKYLHIKSAAHILGCSEQYVRMKCDQSELLCRIVGGAWYVEEGSLIPYSAQKQLRAEGKAIQAARHSKEAHSDVRRRSKETVRIVGAEIRKK